MSYRSNEHEITIDKENSLYITDSKIRNIQKWTIEEDQMLINFYDMFQDNWSKISNELGNNTKSTFVQKSMKDCRDRFKELAQK